MIFAIIGASGSGKNSVCDRVFKIYGIRKAKSWITRDKRKEESKDDYYFINKINKKTLDNSITHDEHRGYQVGTYEEEFAYSDVYTYQSRKGVEQLINKFGKDNVCVIFIYATKKECKDRLHRLGNEKRKERMLYNDTGNEYCPLSNVDYIIRNKQGCILNSRYILKSIIDKERD